MVLIKSLLSFEHIRSCMLCIALWFSSSLMYFYVGWWKKSAKAVSLELTCDVWAVFSHVSEFSHSLGVVNKHRPRLPHYVVITRYFLSMLSHLPHLFICPDPQSRQAYQQPEEEMSKGIRAEEREPAAYWDSGTLSSWPAHLGGLPGPEQTGSDSFVHFYCVWPY